MTRTSKKALEWLIDTVKGGTGAYRDIKKFHAVITSYQPEIAQRVSLKALEGDSTPEEMAEMVKGFEREGLTLEKVQKELDDYDRAIYEAAVHFVATYRKYDRRGEPEPICRLERGEFVWR